MLDPLVHAILDAIGRYPDMREMLWCLSSHVFFTIAMVTWATHHITIGGTVVSIWRAISVQRDDFE